MTPEESVAFDWLDSIPHDSQAFGNLIQILETSVGERDIIACRVLVDPLTARLRDLGRVLEKLQQRTEEYQDTELSKLAARDLRELMRGLLLVAYSLRKYLERFRQEHPLCQLIRNEKLVDCLQKAHEGVNEFVLGVRQLRLKDDFNKTASDLGLGVSALNRSEVYWRGQVNATAQALQDDIQDHVRRIYEDSTDPEVRHKVELTLEYESQRSRGRNTVDPFINAVRNAMPASATEVQLPSWFLPSDIVFLGERISKGGYGEVWHATLDMVTHVVVKRVLKEKNLATAKRLLSEKKTAVERAQQKKIALEQRKLSLEREVCVWQHLTHPHILQFYGATAFGADCSIVSELAPYGPLSRYWVNQEDASSDPVHKQDVWRLLVESSLGLQYMHSKGFVHGDLKCDNIVIGDDCEAKIADFGLSFEIGDHDNVPCTEAANWLAPECLDKEPKRARTFATDVFMFGMCIVEALTDSPPWGNMLKAQIRYQFVTKKALPYIISHFAPAVQELVRDMCKLEPEERISMGEVVERLKRFEAVQDPQLLKVSEPPI